jgi:flavin-dependent dehydrogenase
MEITEKSFSTPVKGVFDIIVCGAGPAGTAAALAAARQNMKVLLIEKNQYCGGIWTAGFMPWFLDHRNKTGILDEIRSLCLTRGG